MENKSFHKGVVFTILSAFSLGFVGLFGKLGSERLAVSALIFWRFFASFWICALLLFALGRMKGALRNLLLGKRHALRSVFTLGAQFCFYAYLQKNTLMNGMVLLNTGPLFIPLIERVLLGRKIGKSTWVSLAVGFVGVLCILQPDKGIFSWMSLVGLASGLSQGISQVLFGMNVERERYDHGVLSLFFFVTLFSLVPYFFGPPSWEGEKSWSWALWLMLGLGIASTLNQMFRGAGYEHSTPSRLSSFLYIAVLLAGIFDWAVFGNVPNALTIIGACLVVLGGILKIYLRARILKSQNR